MSHDSPQTNSTLLVVTSDTRVFGPIHDGSQSKIYRLAQSPHLAVKIYVKGGRSKEDDTAHLHYPDGSTWIMVYRDEPDVLMSANERSALAVLRHPHIIKMHGYGEFTYAGSEEHKKAYPYIILDYLPGESLHALLQKGKLPLSRLVNIVTGAARGLREVHRQGLIHKDVKSSNVMVGSSDHATLIDFGLCIAYPTSQESQIVSGTPLYMSPEQVMGRSLDQRTDIYALGVVLFEALTGQLPCTGTDQLVVLSKKVNTDAPDIMTIAPNTPPCWAAMTNRALQRDVLKRQSTMDDFLGDLETAALNI